MLDCLMCWTLDTPRATSALALILAALAAVALSRVTPVADTTQALRTPAARTLARVQRLFGIEDQAHLLLEADRSGREEELQRLAAALRERLVREPLVRAVSGGEPASRPLQVAPAWLLYFDPATLAGLLDGPGMDERLARAASRLSMPGLGAADRWVERDPLELHRPLAGRLLALRGARPDRSADGRALLLTVTGARPASDLAAARGMVAAIERAAREALARPWTRGLSVRVAGGYSLAEESERIIRRDLIRGLALSITLAALLLAIGLRVRAGAVVLLCLPTLWGALAGIGLYCALVPRLQALSLGCSAILVGLGVDFTIHLAAAAIVRCDSGEPPRQAVEGAVRETRGRLLLAALTSTAAFAAFGVSDQLFLRQMGQLTALGILCCLAGALVLLPPLLVRLLASAGPLRTLGAVAVATQAAARPRAVLAGATALSLLAVAALARSPGLYEQDLRRIHARDSAPLAAQRRIVQVFGGAADPLLLLVEAGDEDAALEACVRLEAPLQRLVADGTLASYLSPAGLLPDPARRRAARDVLARHEPEQVMRRLRAALERHGFDPRAFAGYVQAVGRAVTPELGLRDGGLGPLLDRVVGRDGAGAAALIVVQPGQAPWTAERQALLRRRLQGALDEARARGALSGMLLVSAESADQVRRDFGNVSALTLLAVLAVLLVRFRRPVRVLLVLLPAGLGALWTAGLLAALDIPLNLMNLGVLPMVLALGVDDGIHLVAHRLEHPCAGVDAIYRATGTAVVLTSLTTMVTFGSLALSANRGLSSVGLLSLSGIGACLCASLLVLPPLLARRTI